MCSECAALPNQIQSELQALPTLCLGGEPVTLHQFDVSCFWPSLCSITPSRGETESPDSLRRGTHMSTEHKFAWGLLCVGTGVCVLTALLLPKYVVIALVFAGICFGIGAYLLGALSSPIRAVTMLAFISAGLVFVYWFVRPVPASPKLAIMGYEVELFKPHENAFANIFFRNTGGEGNITVYSLGALALSTANPQEIAKELMNSLPKVVASGNGLPFDVKPQEPRWFTVMGPRLTPEQRTWLRNGKYAFYFSGTIINGFDGKNYDFCAFVEGNKPKVILQCPMEGKSSN
jgi:hypothetical protein